MIFLLFVVPLAFAAWPDPFDRTVGGVWPQPLKLAYSNQTIAFDPRQLKVVSKYSCDILTSAVVGFKRKLGSAKSSLKGAPLTLSISVTDTRCPAEPQLGMDESYTLTVNASGILLTSTEVWGSIRGLETLSQLAFHSSSGPALRAASVVDAPRFPHRGLLLDTSRHFYAVPVIKAMIELLAQNKMNVFHWHLTDSEAFPFKPQSYPELANGAYDQNHVYSVQDIKDVVAFARLRGVRVVPEIDTPGHARSWGKGIPQLTPRCFDTLGAETFDRAMLDPTNGQTYDILTALFKEIFTLFPDTTAHLGGDEVEFWMTQCWMNNPNITAYMKIWAMTTAKELEQHYFDRFLEHLKARDMPRKQFMVWQEVLDMGLQIEGVIGHVWKGNTNTEQMEEMSKVVKAGHLAVLSSCWYLDRISWDIDYKTYYGCDPQGFTGTSMELSRVLGGEAAMWGEMADGSNVLSRVFPRASAVAEKLWSSKEFTTRDGAADTAYPRLLEWQCRMVQRGFPAQAANGPGFCPVEYIPSLPDLNF